MSVSELNVTEEIDDPGEGVDARVLVATRMIEFSQRDAKNDVVAGFGGFGGGNPAYNRRIEATESEG